MFLNREVLDAAIALALKYDCFVDDIDAKHIVRNADGYIIHIWEILAYADARAKTCFGCSYIPD